MKFKRVLRLLRLPEWRCREQGQSALESLITMALIFFMLSAVIHLSLICCTKLVANYSAWIAARVWAVNSDDAVNKAQRAGVKVLRIIEWRPIRRSFFEIRETREGVWVEYPTTLGMPVLFSNNQAGTISVKAWGTVPRDPNLDQPEEGDNREP